MVAAQLLGFSEMRKQGFRSYCVPMEIGPEIET